MIGPVLTAVGVGVLAVSEYANRYHSRRMQEHLNAMRDAYLHRGEHEAVREHEDFMTDRRVSISVWLLSWGMPLGMLLTGAGLAIWLL